jgi:D-sedoheptulose 7-phosphate isomerase
MTSHLSLLLERYPQLRECETDLRAALQILSAAFQSGNKLLICGNGGSAADCEHLVGELMKGFQKPRRIPDSDVQRLTSTAGALGSTIAAKLQGAFPAISLVSQSSLISAISNDTGSEMVFAQQVYGFGKAGDVLLAISTSGNSANVLNAVAVAKTFGVRTIALTGRSGGALASMVDVAIRVPADSVAEIQELHLPVYHWLAIECEERFFGETSP